MQYHFSHICQVLNGQTLQQKTDAVISAICTDTRQQIIPDKALFFCLTGRNDGHQYIMQAYQKGIRNFIVSKDIDITAWPEANICKVADTLNALQEFAAHHRAQFALPVIGITGSNGKTIVKEWLYQLLSPEKKVVKSPKSYNSQIGVPLSVTLIEPEHELGIFEAGISTTGEMVNLQKIIEPAIGIFTNIGSAHDAGFHSTEEKILEKMKLFSNCKTLIYCSDYENIGRIAKDKADKMQLLTFGTSADAVIRLQKKGITGHSTHYLIAAEKFGLSSTALTIPFGDHASVENCLHCVACLLHLGYSLPVIQQKIYSLRNLPMRLELKYGINNCMIMDDSYSADFSSFQVALDFYSQQESKKKKTLIISDFEESGLEAKVYIQKLKAILQQTRFDKLIGVGTSFMQHIESLASVVKEWYVFETTEKLLAQFQILHFENEFILLKGGRRFAFEKISAQLIGQTHATVLEINLNALVNNLQAYRQHLSAGTGVIAMVKAFSYGSGSVEVASLLEKQRVDYLAVAYADEGVVLRKNGIHTPIIVMNPDVIDFDRMLENQLEPEIYSLYILRELIQKLQGKSISIHLKLETGMNRLGFVEADLQDMLSLLQEHPNITVKTIFSHLAASEDAGFDLFTRQQIAHFENLSGKIQQALSYPVKRHLANSSGIIRFPEARYDYVRLGIGLYGVDSSGTIQSSLQTIGKLKTRIAQIKYVKAGESVGYSRKGKTDKDSKIAILAIGYADGYDRRFGNGNGEVFINGQRASIIGNICMDMCMADITHIDEVNEGDEAEIYGKEISIIEQAKKIGTISYELLTHISSRVKRLYYLD